VKTTIDLHDELLRRAKIRAAERGETLRELVERAVRRELESGDTGTEYVPADAAVGGGEINPNFLPWHWDKVRDLIYEDRDA